MNTTVLTPTAPPGIAPPFTPETALRKVRLAEDAWNSRDPHRVSLAYTEDSVWRNRGEFVTGRDAVRAFLTRKWEKEREYRLVKALWAFTDDRSPFGSGTSGGRRRPLVPLLRQRAVGVRRPRADVPPGGEHQRRADRRGRADVLRPAPGPRPADHPGIHDVR